MLNMTARISLLLAFLLALAAGYAHAAEPALLTRFVAGRSLDETTEHLKQAITSRNFNFVRQQAIDSRLVPADWEAKSVRIVYFCNFDRMDTALRRDPRTTQVMPCRITLIEGRHGVDLVAVNPAWVGEQWDAPGLQPGCLQMKEDYLAILEETAL
jgi:uncharacterized protein (DUF302 family)